MELLSRDLVYIAFAYVISCVAAESGCPDACRCRGSQVDCRKTGQFSVPFGLASDTLELDVGENYFPSLNRSSFPLLSKLQKLYLDGCRLSRLKKDAFRNFQMLEVLDLSRNELAELDAGVFFKLTELRELRLGYNNLGHARDSLPGFIFRGLSLEVLDLRGNRIADLRDNVFEKSKSITSLHLSENDFRDLKRQVFSPIERSLKTLTMSNNRLPVSIDDDIFDGFNFTYLEIVASNLSKVEFIKSISVERLDLSDNPLYVRMLEASGGFSRSCRELRLSNVGLETLNKTFFAKLSLLRRLDLSRNKLVSIDESIFKHLPALKILYISTNPDLAKLPANFSASLRNLEYLNLTGSALTSVDWVIFFDLSRLQILDLSYNRLQTIPESFARVLDSVSGLNITGNPLHCNCEMRWFRNWIRSTDRQTGPHRCATPSSRLLIDAPFEKFTCTPPIIVNITKNMTVDEGTDDVLLRCTAQSDPASSVVWTSPHFIKQGITPSDDRTRNKTYAYWKFSKIRSNDEGWYECNATNIMGSKISKTYLRVIKLSEKGSSTETPTVGVTTISTSQTVPSRSSTPSVETTSRVTIVTTEEEMDEIDDTMEKAPLESRMSSSMSTNSQTKRGTVFESRSIFSSTQTLTVPLTSGNFVASPSGFFESKKTMLIILVVVIGVGSLLVVVIIIVAAVALYRQSRRRKYLVEEKIKRNKERTKSNLLIWQNHDKRLLPFELVVDDSHLANESNNTSGLNLLSEKR